MSTPSKQHHQPHLVEWRCPICDRLLQQHRLPKREPYVIITVCPRCKSTVTLQNQTDGQAV